MQKAKVGLLPERFFSFPEEIFSEAWNIIPLEIEFF
jgi:hypothetical protein